MYWLRINWLLLACYFDHNGVSSVYDILTLVRCHIEFPADDMEFFWSRLLATHYLPMEGDEIGLFGKSDEII